MWHQLAPRPQAAAAKKYKDYAVALDSPVLCDAGLMSPSLARECCLGGMALILPHVLDPERLWSPYHAPQRLMTAGEPRPAHIALLFVAGLLARAEPATSQL
jgi:hypothetical protein